MTDPQVAGDERIALLREPAHQVSANQLKLWRTVELIEFVIGMAILVALWIFVPHPWWLLPLFVALVLGDLVLMRSEEHTSELQSPMRISYAVFCLKKTTEHAGR